MQYKEIKNPKINKKKYPQLRYVTKEWFTTCGVYHIMYDCRKGFKHLRISRIDGKPIHNYMDMLRIKNDLWGKNTVAIEVYPAQGNFVDGSNTYHLWTWKDIKTPNLMDLYEYTSFYREAGRKAIIGCNYFGFLWFTENGNEKQRWVKAKNIDDACRKFLSNMPKTLYRIDCEVQHENDYISISNRKEFNEYL